jgi:hypothetical protein
MSTIQKRGRKKKIVQEEVKNDTEKQIKETENENQEKETENQEKETENQEKETENQEKETENQEKETENQEKEEDEIKGVEKIKKKRGRKPKNEVKEEIKESEINEDVSEVNEEEDENIIYKKRGRKPRPKEKIYNIKEMCYENYDEDKSETLILHLPIKSSDIFSNNIPKGISNQKTPIATYNLDGTCEETVQVPLIQINENTKYEEILKSTQIEKKDYTIVFEENTDDNKVNLIEEYDKKVKEFKEFKLMNYVKVISNKNNESFENKNNDEHVGNGTLLKELENEDLTQKKFKVNPFMESTHIENEIIQEHSNKMNKKNLKNIMVEFINANMYQEWPDQTNIHCWWCCNQFDGPPCTLPEYIRRDKFYVSGCFCSFNCAASYNFNKNDNNVWERYTLLNLMYKKLYNLPFVKIEMAPPREVLKMFGGYMDIEEFRNYCIKQDRKFQVIKPPLISIIPKIEEHIYPKNKVVNENILNNTQTKLKLTRSKPLIAEKSTIQTFMNITTKKDDDE